jgi:hypothetical protein
MEPLINDITDSMLIKVIELSKNNILPKYITLLKANIYYCIRHGFIHNKCNHSCIYQTNHNLKAKIEILSYFQKFFTEINNGAIFDIYHVKTMYIDFLNFIIVQNDHEFLELKRIFF